MKTLRIAAAVAFLLGTLFWTPIFAGSWESTKTSGGAAMESPRTSEGTLMESPKISEEAATMESGFRAHQFLDRDAKNAEGETLGTVSDFVFDQNGKIEYVILSYRTDSTEKLIPIPFDVVRVTPRSAALMVDISKDRLTNAPALAQWKDFDDPEWTREVHSYYESAGAEPGAMERSNESATGLPKAQEGCSGMKMKHQGTKMDHQGMESPGTEPSQTEPQGQYQY